MRVWIGLLAVGLMGAVVAGCAGMTAAPVVPPPGLVFSSYTAPLDVDLDKTQLGAKRGQASVTSILGLFSFGDAGTQAAARSAGINTIHHADYKATNVLGIFSTYTTIVYGD